MLFQLLFSPTNTGALFGDIASEDILMLVFKIMFIIAGLLYVLFAGVVIRQISVMRSTLITSFSMVIQLLGYAHFLLAIGVFIFFILFL